MQLTINNVTIDSDLFKFTKIEDTYYKNYDRSFLDHATFEADKMYGVQLKHGTNGYFNRKNVHIVKGSEIEKFVNEHIDEVNYEYIHIVDLTVGNDINSIGKIKKWKVYPLNDRLYNPRDIRTNGLIALGLIDVDDHFNEVKLYANKPHFVGIGDELFKLIDSDPDNKSTNYLRGTLMFKLLHSYSYWIYWNNINDTKYYDFFNNDNYYRARMFICEAYFDYKVNDRANPSNRQWFEQRFGEDGYRAVEFVDYVIENVIKPQVK